MLNSTIMACVYLLNEIFQLFKSTWTTDENKLFSPCEINVIALTPFSLSKLQ